MSLTVKERVFKMKYIIESLEYLDFKIECNDNLLGYSFDDLYNAVSVRLRCFPIGIVAYVELENGVMVCLMTKFDRSNNYVAYSLNREKLLDYVYLTIRRHDSDRRKIADENCKLCDINDLGTSEFPKYDKCKHCPYSLEYSHEDLSQCYEVLNFLRNKHNTSDYLAGEKTIDEIIKKVLDN